MRLFVCYARNDADNITRLMELLLEGGLEPWYDRWLHGGQVWQDELLKEIQACDAFVYLLSPASLASEWCQWEYYEARRMNKPIFPVLLTQAALELPPELQQVHHEDISEGLSPQAAARVVGALWKLNAMLAAGVDPNAPHERPLMPFEPETVLIPAGEFKFGEKVRPVVLPEYRIGKYPVTVAEYRRFIQQGGYKRKGYWTPTGWQWLFDRGRTQPRFWDDPLWTGNDLQPVIGITWYEAQAYCRWLADETGRPYRLPLEEEWEKAARGTNGQLYPWGRRWRDGVCNTFEAGFSRTTPVGYFSPHGDSPYGIADMAGNVWEWCDSYEQDADRPDQIRCAVRGGSWCRMKAQAQVTARCLIHPYFGISRHGFRVVCAPPLT